MDERVATVIALMKKNFHRSLTPAELAKAVRLSPSHLRELFKRETETSLARYQKDLRLEQAKHLLETTFMSIKEVAASVGIGRVSHFVRDFKTAFQITPARYARRYREAEPTV